MKVNNIFILELKKIFNSKLVYVSILLSLLFGAALVYSIKVDQGPFTIRAVSSFYGIVSTYAVAIFGLKTFMDDLNDQTIVLIFSSTKNRKSYLIGKLLAALFIGLIFGIICSVFITISSFILGWEIDLLTYIISPIYIYILYSAFYMLFFFLIGIFIRKTTTLISLSILFIIAIPSFLEGIIHIKGIPNMIKVFIEKLPLYYLTGGTKLLQLSGIENITTVIGIIILFIGSYYFVTREDY